MEKSNDHSYCEKKLPRSISTLFRGVMILLLVIAMILLSVAALIYTHNTAAAMETELCDKMLLSVVQTGNNIDYRLEQIAEATSVLLRTMNPYLNSNADTSMQIEEYEEIKRLMSEMVGRHMITSLRLFVPDTKIYTNQQTSDYAIYSFVRLEDYPQKYASKSVFWNSTHKIHFPTSTPTDVITCEMSLRSLEDFYSFAGILCADVDAKQFSDVFRAGITEGEEIFLINSDGTILAHNDSNRFYESPFSQDTVDKILEESTGYFVAGNKIIVFCKLEMTDWYVISQLDRNRVYVMDASAALSISVLWIASFLIVVIVAIAMWYSLNLNRMVRQINHAIKSLENETGLQGESGGMHEIAIRGTLRKPLFSLELDTEKLVRSIADILESRYQEKLEVSKYQMESLQAQIKPHFLYNTLDVIKWMIMDEKIDDGIWMVNALSKYLRMSINKGDQVVTLNEELSLTRTYLGIMQKRFNNRFTTSFEIDPITQACTIPKLSLQPLVENALLHGILHCKKPDLCLTVRSWVTSGTICIEVEDNGCGMSQEQATRLSQMNVQRNYGIANVHKRLSIFAGGECVFSIFSQVEKGTCVTIELPFRSRTEE